MELPDAFYIRSESSVLPIPKDSRLHLPEHPGRWREVTMEF